MKLGTNIKNKMRLLIVFPDTKIINGNMVTTSRWELSWSFDIEVLQLSEFLERRDDLVFDQLIILHARKCAKIVDSNAILVLSGTDLSSLCDISKRSIAIAKKVVSLRPLTASEQSNIHHEVSVITQGREQMQRCPPRQNVETLRVVIIANDRPEKNLDILPIVCANLKVSITIMVIGASDRLEYFNNVPQIIHLGCQSPQAATEAILQADVILCPSHSEGMSDVFVQAVCSSSPILCSLIPSTQYVLTENYAGMFLSNDAGHLVRLLTKCVESPTFLQELSESVAAASGKLSQHDETEAWKEILSA
jgi:hypothetical protein